MGKEAARAGGGHTAQLPISSHRPPRELGQALIAPPMAAPGTAALLPVSPSPLAGSGVGKNARPPPFSPELCGHPGALRQGWVSAGLGRALGRAGWCRRRRSAYGRQTTGGASGDGHGHVRDLSPPGNPEPHEVSPFSAFSSAPSTVPGPRGGEVRKYLMNECSLRSKLRSAFEYLWTDLFPSPSLDFVTCRITLRLSSSPESLAVS